MSLRYWAIASPAGNGRWLVVYQVPGAPGVVASAVDCPSRAVADRVAQALNRTH